MFRSILIFLILFLNATFTYAQPTPVDVKVWADRNNVLSLDMTPDAKRIAMLMRRERGADAELLLFETENIGGSMEAIQPEGLRPINIFWANNTYLVVNFILALEDGGRPVNIRRTASYNIETKKWTSLIRIRGGLNPRTGSAANAVAKLGIGQVINSLRGDPDHVLVSHTEGDSAPNYYKTNIKTGARKLVMRGGGRFNSYVFDFAGNARGAQEYDPRTNRILFFARVSTDDDWKQIGELNAANRDRFSLLGFFDADRPQMATIVADEPGSNYQNIYDVDIRTGKRETLFATNSADAITVIRSPRISDGGAIVGFVYADKESTKRYFIDPELEALDHSLRAAFPEKDVSITRLSDDGKTVLVYVNGPQDVGKWYLMRDGKLAPILSVNPEIPNSALSPTKLIAYRGRDGFKLSGYVTIPAGMEGPLPTIAMPHGGPWVRDYRGYDKWAQMLANQGYVVFQPNYRGSSQLGKEHWLAGDNKWGMEMQDDVEDGVNALVRKGIANPEKLAIFGWSYGGYSAFVAATRDNPMFNCMVAGAGVADLSTIRGGVSGNRFLRQFQKPTITGVSPINIVDKVTKPMLLVHGDYDFTVQVKHSRRFADGLEKIGADYKYIEIEDMGHSPIEYEQNMQWFPSLFDFFDTKCGF